MKKKFLILLFCVSSLWNVLSVEIIDDLSFVDTDITQVIKTISEIFEVTIVPDKDVHGNITRYFKNTNFEQTMFLLLDPQGYTYEKKDTIYFVKKKPQYTIDYDEKTNLFQIISNNGSLKEILNELSLKSKTTIVYDKLPQDEVISVNIFQKTLEETIDLLLKNKKVNIKKENLSFIIKPADDDISFADFNTKQSKFLLNGDEDNIEIKIFNQLSNDVILSLFKKYNKRLSLLSNKSVKIPYLDMKNVKFNDLLLILFEHSGQSYTKINDTYYVYDSLKQNQTDSYLTTEIYKLKNLTPKTFASNIPAQIVPVSCYKIDTDTNSIIFIGSPNEVAKYLNYVKTIDLSLKEYAYRTFKLKNIDVKNIKNFLPDYYKKMEINILEDQDLFTIYLDNYDYDKFKAYIEMIDNKVNKEWIYKFKYLKPEDVLKSMLPASIKKDQVILNDNNSSLIFNISEETKNELFDYLDKIDVPPPVIRYQLLIIEYMNEDTFRFNRSLEIKKSSLSDFIKNNNDSNFSVGLFTNDSTFNANFDIPTIFGIYFTATLDLLLQEKKAKIQMSTEVYGISGQTVNLGNTQTLSYKEYVTIDGESNLNKISYKTTTFGLNLDIKGRATSSDEVYLEISAKISDELPGTSAGEAPNTTEKSVKNFVRTQTGKPIILGGLTSQKESKSSNKIPGLGDIPILGEAFKTQNSKYTSSEFVIYVIPFIQKSEKELKDERMKLVEQMFNYFNRDTQ